MDKAEYFFLEENAQQDCRIKNSPDVHTTSKEEKKSVRKLIKK